MALNLKYIRKGIRDVLGNTTPIFNNIVPKDENPTTYILIINQLAQTYERSKDCFEYSSQFSLDLCTIAGHQEDKTTIIDDLHYEIESKIYNLKVDGYIVKDIEFVGSTPADVTSGVNTINRRILTYNIWITHAR